MINKKIEDLRQEIIQVCQEIWRLNLVSGSAGNVSCRIDKDHILITPHASYLGYLTKDEILELDLEGNVVGKKGMPSLEKTLHLAIYKNLEANAVVHTHPVFATAFFSVQEDINYISFEAKLTLGKIPVVSQDSPQVVDVRPVIEALKINNVVALKNHGIVSIGTTLKDAFFLTQELESAIKMDAVSRLYNRGEPLTKVSPKETGGDDAKKFKLFSPEHIRKIVDLVNGDTELSELGKRMDLTLQLAVKLDSTRQVYSFNFLQGKITDVSNNENVEFLISGQEQYWRQIFNRQLDPFVATTQKKLKLKGDFAKLSKWYVAFNRLFDLWREAPVK